MTRRNGRALTLARRVCSLLVSARMAGALVCQAIAHHTVNYCDVCSSAANRVRKSAATSARAVLLRRWVEQATMRRVDLPACAIIFPSMNADPRHDGTKASLPRLGYYRKGWRLHVDHAILWRIARATGRGKD